MWKVTFFAAINLVVLGSLTAPVVTGLPIAIARLVPDAERTAALAEVTIIGAIASVLANPLFGLASDRTRGRLGRRRPWLLAGVVVGLAASVIIVTAGSVAALTVGWVLAQTAYNACLAAVAALLGDQVDEKRRASASGVFGAAAFLGTLPPLVLATIMPTRLDVVVLAMPITAVVVVVICCVFITDPPMERAATTSIRTVSIRTTRGHSRSPRPPIDLRRYRAFGWIWLQRFLMQLAFSLATVFTLYFVMERLTLGAEAGSPVVAMTTLIGGAGIVVAALAAGFLASRSGRYGAFIVTAALGLAAAAALRATASDSAQLWVSAAIGGTALGIFYAVDLALVLRAIPAGEAGAYLGVFNIAETLPQTIAPALALGVLAVAGESYTSLYLVAATVAMLALVPLPFVRSTLSRTAQFAAAEPRQLAVR
jgi:MFS family permease